MITIDSYCSFNLQYNKHIKPRDKSELGYWLAGLIDADGHICYTGAGVVINTHKREVGVLSYIHHTLLKSGYRYSYKKVKAIRYTTRKASAPRLAHLIANKLQLPNKIKQFNERLAPHVNSALCYDHTTIRLDNHWFAGFVQGDGYFGIAIRKPQKPGGNRQVEICLLIELKQRCLLEKIKKVFGGFVGQRKSRDTYYYSSVNLTNAQKLVAYFDRYQVMGPSYRLYLCWRRALSLVLEKKHLTPQGLEEIKILKAYMTQLRS